MTVNGALVLRTPAAPTPVRETGLSLLRAPGTPGEQGEYSVLPDTIWQHPSAPHVSLRQLVDEFALFLRGRSNRASEQTITKYTQSLDLFLASIAAAGEPLVLRSMTAAAGARWVAEQRAGTATKKPLSEETIASRQYAVKAFSSTYVCKHLDLTHWDHLRKWVRLRPEAKVKERLSDLEIKRVLDATEEHANPYVGTRNRAMVMVLLSTGIRLGACHKMKVGDVDPVSGEFTVAEKAGRAHKVRLSPNAQKAVRRWLRERRAKGTDAMWTTDHGHPITYNGMQIVFWRLKRDSGVLRVHPHLARHTFGQVAIEKGAERALVQDMLGHRSDAMTWRYTKNARESTAALRQPEFSPV